MSTVISLATHKITRRTVRISDKTKTCFVETGNNFRRMHVTTPVRHNCIKTSNACATTVRNSGMIDRTFKPIVSIVREAATRPKRINARCTMIGETYQSTGWHIKMGLLAQSVQIANNHVCSQESVRTTRKDLSDGFGWIHRKKTTESQTWFCMSTTVSGIRNATDRRIAYAHGKGGQPFDQPLTPESKIYPLFFLHVNGVCHAINASHPTGSFQGTGNGDRSGRSE